MVKVVKVVIICVVGLLEGKKIWLMVMVRQLYILKLNYFIVLFSVVVLMVCLSMGLLIIVILLIFRWWWCLNQLKWVYVLELFCMGIFCLVNVVWNRWCGVFWEMEMVMWVQVVYGYWGKEELCMYGVMCMIMCCCNGGYVEIDCCSCVISGQWLYQCGNVGRVFVGVICWDLV